MSHICDNLHITMNCSQETSGKKTLIAPLVHQPSRNKAADIIILCMKYLMLILIRGKIH